MCASATFTTFTTLCTVLGDRIIFRPISDKTGLGHGGHIFMIQETIFPCPFKVSYQLKDTERGSNLDPRQQQTDDHYPPPPPVLSNKAAGLMSLKAHPSSPCRGEAALKQKAL